MQLYCRSVLGCLADVNAAELSLHLATYATEGRSADAIVADGERGAIGGDVYVDKVPELGGELGEDVAAGWLQGARFAHASDDLSVCCRVGEVDAGGQGPGDEVRVG